MKNLIKRTPIIGTMVRKTTRKPFPGSTEYWLQRYESGRNSGVGSYGKFADFKAQVLNEFVRQHTVTSVIEYGCGDGNQVALAEYPAYIGFDISPHAISECQNKFEADDSKSFRVTGDYDGERADLILSLDVIYHLIEDDVFTSYMSTLFDSSDRFVIVYSSNTDENEDDQAPHVKHRKFTDWVNADRPEWTLIDHIPNPYPYKGDYMTGSFADFYIFERSELRLSGGSIQDSSSID